MVPLEVEAVAVVAVVVTVAIVTEYIYKHVTEQLSEHRANIM